MKFLFTQNARVCKNISVVCGYGQLGSHYLAFMRIFASAICKFRNFLVSRKGHDTHQGVDISFLKGSTACGIPLLTSRLNRLVAKEMWGGE